MFPKSMFTQVNPDLHKVYPVFPKKIHIIPLPTADPDFAEFIPTQSGLIRKGC